MSKFDLTKITELKRIAEDIDDANMLKDLVKLFVETVPKQLKEVKAYQKENNAAQLKVVFHSIKSTATILGLINLQEECAKQEMNSKQGKIISCEEINFVEIQIENSMKFLLDLESKEFNF